MGGRQNLPDGNPMNGRDAILGVATWLAVTSLLLLYVHKSKQTGIPRTAARSRMVAVRAAVLCIVAFLGLGWGLGVTSPRIALGLLIATPIVLLTSLKAYEGPHHNVLGVGLVVLIVTPPYVLKQYLLGFPDYDEIVLLPPRSSSAASPIEGASPGPAQKTENSAPAPDAMIPDGPQVATAVSVLRPAGTVAIRGARFAAISVDGTLIPVGAEVEVCGERNQSLLVRPLRETSPATS